MRWGTFVGFTNANAGPSQTKEHFGGQIGFDCLKLPAHMLCTKLAYNNMPLIAGEPTKLGGWLPAVTNCMRDDPIYCVCLMYIASWN